jgi:hypothetical protein
MTRLAILALGLFLASPAAAAEPEASLLVNGSFELLEKGRPVGWEVTEGARNRDGSSFSDWYFGSPAHSGNRSLKLAGTATTAAWTLLKSEPVAVEPGTLLRLSGWMRTENVRRESTQWTNCNIGVAFETAEGEVATIDGYPVAGTPPLLGTREWTRVERVLRVPANAASARATCFLSLSGEAWFDDVGLETVELPDWVRVETERFVFFEPKDARLSDGDRAKNERELAELEATLGLKLPAKVQFYRYADEEQKVRVTGRGGIGHVELPGRLHTLRRSHPHELVHLLTATVGPPESILFGEGLAVHLAGDWQGRPLDVVVRELEKAGELPRLVELADLASFSRLPETRTHPTSGSFVRYLVQTGGMDAFKQIYPRHGQSSSPATLEARLQERYGAGLLELEARWRAAILGE